MYIFIKYPDILSILIWKYVKLVKMYSVQKIMKKYNYNDIIDSIQIYLLLHKLISIKEMNCY